MDLTKLLIAWPFRLRERLFWRVSFLIIIVLGWQNYDQLMLMVIALYLCGMSNSVVNFNFDTYSSWGRNFITKFQMPHFQPIFSTVTIEFTYITARRPSEPLSITYENLSGHIHYARDKFVQYSWKTCGPREHKYCAMTWYGSVDAPCRERQVINITWLIWRD